MPIFIRRLGALALLALLTGCAETGDPVGVAPVDPPPVETGRPVDPGLSFPVACTASLPLPGKLENNLTPDAIPALDRPGFVAADEVDFLSPRDRVFGIEIEGRLLALPRRILNLHEVVTLAIPVGEETAQALASWCPLTFSFRLWRAAPHQPEALFEDRTFGVSGSLLNLNLVMYDRATRSLWSQIPGLALTGPRAGECMGLERNVVDTTWDLWRRLHPQTSVLSNRNGLPEDVYDDSVHEITWAQRGTPWADDTPANERDVVLGVHGDGEIVAVLPGRAAVIHARVGATPAVFFQHPPSATILTFENSLDGTERQFASAEPAADGLPRFCDEESGSLWSIDGIAVEGPLAGRRLAQLPSLRLYWAAWASFFPENRVIKPGSKPE